MKKVTLILAALACLSLMACNTVQGIGRDLEKGGEAIQKSAQ